MNIFEKIVRKTGQAIAEYRMIGIGDRIAVGLSGGKDSLVLMHVLTELQKRAPIRFEIEAVTFDPGFDGFNSAAIAEYANSQNWRHRIIPLDVKNILIDKEAQTHPCVLCSRLRRGLLYTTALEMGCGKLALGQHLDDICISLLISLSRGRGVFTMGPNVPAVDKPIRVIRPLCFVAESMIESAKADFSFPDSGRCEYKDQLEADGDRAYFKRLLADMSVRIPRVRQNMLAALRNVKPELLLDPRFLFEQKPEE
jgi:tRNA 2-thiocytidine biosynthesis protein TtcA